MTSLDDLAGLLDRYDDLPRPAKTAIWPLIQETATKVVLEMIELEEDMSRKRDWLDANMLDPRYERRKAKFMDVEVRQHAAYGEALERVERALTTGVAA